MTWILVLPLLSLLLYPGERVVWVVIEVVTHTYVISEERDSFKLRSGYLYFCCRTQPSKSFRSSSVISVISKRATVLSSGLDTCSAAAVLVVVITRLVQRVV